MSLVALRRLAGLPAQCHAIAMPLISLLSGGLLDRGDLDHVASFASRSYQTDERPREESRGGGRYSAARHQQRAPPPPLGRRRSLSDYRKLLQHLARRKK